MDKQWFCALIGTNITQYTEERFEKKTIKVKDIGIVLQEYMENSRFSDRLVEQISRVIYATGDNGPEGGR